MYVVLRIYISKSFIAQKKCIKGICGKKARENCRPLFKKLNIFPLSCMHIRDLCIFVMEHASYFKRVSDSRTRITRPNDKLYVPKCRLDLHKRNAYCMAIKVYNHLPNYIREVIAHSV